MKTGSSYERRIRIKVTFIFLVIILYFIGVFFYSYNYKENIKAQKNEVQRISLLLPKTNSLISSLQQEQSIVNAFLFSKKKSYLKNYERISKEIINQIDELNQIKGNGNQDTLLLRISILLAKKKHIVTELSQKDASFRPLDELNQKIKDYHNTVKDSLIITYNRDTTTLKILGKKKGFWKKLKDLFGTEENVDTIIHFAEMEIDTVLKAQSDTLAVFKDIRNLTQKATTAYIKEIIDIERNTKSLMFAEQEISFQISQLLNELHKKTLNAATQNVQKADNLTQKIFLFSLVTGVLSLLLILTLIFFILDDLNKAKKMRAALAKEKQTIEDLMNSRHKLLLSVSHDIKTPLTSIMGYLDLWKKEENSEKKRHQLISVQNSGQHILSLLTNLLQYSRLEQQSGPLGESEFNLPQICTETVGMLMNMAQSKGLKLEFVNKAKENLYVKTDPTAIKQILVNMLSNAIKYTSKGYVQLILTQKNQSLLFEIKDTGVGMAKKDIEKSFKPFSRIENPLISSEGAGFGLYVTKGLVEALNGKIQITSEVNKGTLVSIIIPFKEVDNLVQKTSFEMNKNDNHTESKKILIFEDDDSLVKMLVEILQKMHHTVTVCDDETNIRFYIKDVQNYSLVLADMQMNIITGIDVLKAIRDINQDVPVWLMTAHDDMTEAQAKNLGFSGLLPKPFTLQAIEDILSEKTIRTVSKASNPEKDFPLLYAMFENDVESIKDVLKQFVENAPKDAEKLKEMAAENNFAGAQQVCHKMLSFLSQLSADGITETLRKMDGLRAQDESAYPSWKEDIALFLEAFNTYTRHIKENYLQ